MQIRYYEAAREGDLKALKRCIKKGANPREEKDRALIESARRGHIHIIKYLVSIGLDPLSCNGRALAYAELYAVSASDADGSLASTIAYLKEAKKP